MCSSDLNFPDNVEFVKGLPSSFDSFLEYTEKYICSHSHTLFFNIDVLLINDSWLFLYDVFMVFFLMIFIYDRPKMIVLDDLMHECSSSNMLSETFTRKRHHHNLSVIIVLQNLYSKGMQ